MSRLSWNEIRTRAAAFARDWKDARYERGETQSFWNAFFRIFGVERRRVAVYERSVDKLNGGRGYIDLFWPGELIVEQKSRGKDLFGATRQALDYTYGLSDAEMPKRILVCDFQTFALDDLESGEKIAFALDDLPKHVERFAFILGRQVRRFKDQDPVNIKAAELVGALHDEIKATGYAGHKLEAFLVRIVFCLFADDTGIFEPKDILWEWLETKTAPDGTDMAGKLAQLFDVLNAPAEARQTNLDPELAQFPHVNGDLFREYFPPPAFDHSMWAALINACRFDWTPISPAIFGSLFQSVMDAKKRRAIGAHYTTEKNILKVIEPLFLNDLRAEFETIRARRTQRLRLLQDFQRKLAGLRFLDPACGCGNFLIIAYRELRLLELDVLREVRNTGQLDLMAQTLSLVDVDQFYGIEIEEFPARIAETALWMMDHIMNNRLSMEFGQVFVRIPLKKSPHIVHGDALELDWESVLPAKDCDYVFGNPPFVGAKYQSEAQRAQVRGIARLGKSGGTLDYVAAWFLKAGAYVRGATRIGFVATNSITQGEQVAQLWPLLFQRCGLEIAFAHRTFAWGSDARGKAHVHVVILGLDRAASAPAERRLFSYTDINGDPEEARVGAISPYLIDAGGLRDPHLVVREEARPINGMPRMKTGVQMIDDGLFTFTEEEKAAFVASEPAAEPYFRRYIGGNEYISGICRWILYLRDAPAAELRTLRVVRDRISRVRDYRAGSGRPSTVAMAAYPTHVGVDERPTSDFLVVPNTSSERRDYIPIGWLTTDVVANQKLRILADPPLHVFGILTSAMHMAWMRTVTGRLESRYMYSVGVVYNTFPLPPDADMSKLEPLAQGVLDARAAHAGASLADLYDPDLMPGDLRTAHGALDRAVDRLYRRQGFGSDRERVEHLFGLYEAMVRPLEARRLAKRRRGA